MDHTHTSQQPPEIVIAAQFMYISLLPRLLNQVLFHPNQQGLKITVKWLVVRKPTKQKARPRSSPPSGLQIQNLFQLLGIHLHSSWWRGTSYPRPRWLTLAAPATVNCYATNGEVLSRYRGPSRHGLSGQRAEEAVVAIARESRDRDGGLVVEVSGPCVRVGVFGVVEGGGVLWVYVRWGKREEEKEYGGEGMYRSCGVK